MTELVYSTNNEDYTFTDIEEALEYACDDPDENYLTVYQAEKVGTKASHWLPDICDHMFEIALDNNEYAEGWLNGVDKECQDLQKQIEEVVDKWADKHKLHPYFFMVTNIKERRFKKLKQSECFCFEDFEEVPED